MDVTISTVWTAPWTVGGCATGTAILPSGTVPVDWPAAPSAPGRARHPRWLFLFFKVNLKVAARE